jgi:hypothetical protein
VIDNAARARLERWKQSLLDPADPLAGPVLDAGTTGLPLVQLDPIRAAFALATGAALRVEAGHDAELRELRSVARAALADGEHVLQVALGQLTWIDRAGCARTTPLAFWPVELARGDAGDVVRSARDQAPRRNDLAIQLLVEHGVELPATGDLDLAALFLSVDEAITARDGWQFDRVARLGAFSFAAATVWRELDQRADEILAAAPVQWLAQAATPPVTDVTAAPTDELLLPLDADATQTAAIAAAAAGASFILHGPPGTGKTQTIANLVAHCTSQGKTVLVVSDRGAALDGIHQRLAATGLGELCVSLVGPRAKVTAARAAADARTARPVGAPRIDDARLGDLRTVLDRHAAALHATGPLGMTVHEVVARLVELRTAPCAALAEADAPALDRATFTKRKRAVEQLAHAAIPVEPVTTHAWRTSLLASWPEEGSDLAGRALDEAGAAVTALQTALAELARAVRGFIAKTPEQLRALGALAELAAGSPRPGVELLTSMRATAGDEITERVALIRAKGGGTVEVPRDPATFLVLGQKHRALAAEVAEKFLDRVEGLDATGLWNQLKKWTDSMAPLRFVALRTVRAAMREVAQPTQLETDEAMLAGLEAVIAERACRAALLAAAEPARRWFGELGGDPLTLDFSKIEAAVSWSLDLRRAFEAVAITGGDQSRQTAWRALIAQVAASPAEPRELAAFRGASVFATVADTVARWQRALADLAHATGIPENKLGVGGDHLAALGEQIEGLRSALDSLHEWSRFVHARREAITAGIGGAVTAIDRGDLDAAELAAAWERATLVAWLDAEIACTPALARFQGAAHHTFVAAFADLDRSTQVVARARVLAALAQKTPRISPCLLATPLALVEHVPLAHQFDLVVFDEASRLPTAAVVPALARAKQIVIVGDEHQLPPAGGRDGLLVDALATRLPELSLGAHYRSRHEDLFALANRRFHGDRLNVFPTAVRSADLGISLCMVSPDGVVPDSRESRNEAEAVVAEAATRLRETPHRSLAIIALSHAQQTLIEELIEAEPRLAACQSLLVGTPERVMGEERDVVLLSVGGAAEVLGLAGGERWLGVAMTRAREQMIVFSTYAPEDAPEGAHDLAALLHFARSGAALREEPVPATSITAAIARSLVERGWIVKHQVGCGPTTIDLAVVDPLEPTCHVLAIEHDGDAYGRARTARDRDRLRGQLLARLGWRTHRIWSLDWWRDPEREIQRAHGAIVAALAASRRKRAEAARPATETPRPARRPRGTPSKLTPAQVAAAKLTPIPVVASPAGTPPSGHSVASGSGPAAADSSPIRVRRNSITIGPYAAASVPAGRRAPEDLFAPRYAGEVAKLIERVLAAEAPIHVEVLARRVGAYFGIGKPDERVVAHIKTLLETVARFGTEPGIVWRQDQDPASVPPVRVAGAGASARRDIAEVPLAEVAAAARVVMERTTSLSAADLVRDCARLLGFARLTDKVSERVAEGVRLAAMRELIALDADRVRLVD